MIFITGGTGFLGGTLVKNLEARGERVRLLVRGGPLPEGLKEGPLISFFEGDLRDPEDIDQGLKGCDRVIHAAALVKPWAAGSTLFDEVNIGGLQVAAESAMRAGIEKFCYISSFIALGPTDGITADEGTPYPGHGWHNDYERTKYLADQEMRRYIRKGLRGVIVYPGVVYGPGRMTSGNILARLIMDFHKGKMPGILGDGSRKWSYAYVDDVVDGVIRALEKGRVGGRYILGGDNQTQETLFDELSGLLGLRKPSRHIPYGIAKARGLAEELLARVFGREPVCTPGTIEIFKHDWAYRSDRAGSELGYGFRPLSSGLALTVEWMKKSGLL